MYDKKWLIALSLFSLFASCAVQSVSTGPNKYQQALVQYEAKNYYQAAQLFEASLPQLRGKKEEASAHFYQAYCSYYQKKYVQSAKHFKHFRQTFPRDPRLEEALYMQAYLLYMESPDEQLDQTFTHEAAYLFRNYLEHYADGIYAEKAKAQLEELNSKLARKVFNSAQLYYKLARYRAAIVTLENLREDFPDAYGEKAAYLKVNAQYRCLQTASKNKKREYLSTAIIYCQEFLDSYSESSYAIAVEKMYSALRSLKSL